MKVCSGDVELHVETRGDGPVCVVLSAIGTRPYERMIPSALSDRLRLVFVELRGSGRSSGDPGSLTFDLVADDLDAIRRALGVERVAIFGHSILGALAIESAIRRPEIVSHVIAVGTPPSGDMAAVQAAASAFFEEDASEERKRILEENLAALPEGASMGQVMFAQTPMRFFDPRLDATPLFAEADSRPLLVRHIMTAMTPEWNVAERASSLSVPLFIGHGRHDYTVPWTMWRDVVHAIPGATLHLFDRSGHQPFFEEPERFAKAVVDWMNRDSA